MEIQPSEHWPIVPEYLTKSWSYYEFEYNLYMMQPEKIKDKTERKNRS